MREAIVKLKDRYVELYGLEGVGDDVIDHIQSKLGIELPNDFKDIATFYSGGMLGGISHHAIALTGPANNIVNETERLRDKIVLDRKFIVLAEPANGLVVLDTSSSDGAKVVWCDAQDASRLGKIPLLTPPDTWTSYEDFFAYLVSEEESERD